MTAKTKQNKVSETKVMTNRTMKARARLYVVEHKALLDRLGNALLKRQY